MTEANSRQGTRNRAAGRKWELDCAAWLRGNGWPNASREMNYHHSDLIGTGDFAAECTLEDWARIWAKLRQAAEDAERRGLDEYGVWRKQKAQAGQRGTTDPGAGAMVMPAALFWRMRLELEAFRRADLDAQLSYDRGYQAGREAQERETREGAQI
jgi:hypothetical protein